MTFDNSDLIAARVRDACDFADDGKGVRFIGFLDEKNSYFAERTAANRRVNYMLYGGFGEATRKYIAVFSDYMEISADDFPIVRLHTRIYGDRTLTHRDFLGSLMNGGIKREKIGDICISGDSADIFVSDSVADFVCENITRVGGCTVKFSPDNGDFCPPQAEFDEISFTVNSPRIDSIIAHLTGKSRETAAGFIKSGNVEIDYSPCDSLSRLIKNGEKISARGYGKFIVDSVDGKSKKGRNIIKVRKYK